MSVQVCGGFYLVGCANQHRCARQESQTVFDHASSSEYCFNHEIVYNNKTAKTKGKFWTFAVFMHFLLLTSVPVQLHAYKPVNPVCANTDEGEPLYLL